MTSWILDEHIQSVLAAPSRTSAAPDTFRVETDASLASGPDSDHAYNLVEAEYGRVPDRLFYRVRDKSLARVTARYFGSKPGSYGRGSGPVYQKLPFTLDTYYTRGVEYGPAFSEADDPECRDGFATQYSFGKLYDWPGWTTERWNAPVIGPALPEEIAKAPYPASFLVGGLPPGPGTFRLRTEAIRVHPVSSRVVADFTFRSDTVTGPDSAPFPLLAVRYEPVADQPTVLAVSVDHNTRSIGKVRTLSVSYDRSTSWQPVKLRTAGGKTVVVITRPAGAESVSLRATASDAAGNSVDQTIIDAVRLK